MLKRKPRVGEILDSDSSVVGGTKRAEYRVLRFETGVGKESLMHMVDTATGVETMCIWKFSDGLNKCLSHREFQVGSTTTLENCGNCPHAAEHCGVFRRRVRCYDHDKGTEVLRRLPECVAAKEEPQEDPDAPPQPASA